MSDNLVGVTQKSTDSLPKVFVDSMRTLFEIMDDAGTGYIHIKDIERRWCDQSDANLPPGVLECLHKVAPPSGLLSFDRFVAGLHICLLRQRANRLSQPRRSLSPVVSKCDSSLAPPALTQSLAQQTQECLSVDSVSGSGGDNDARAAVGGSDLVARHQRAASLSQLFTDGATTTTRAASAVPPAPPPKPPRQPPVSQPTRVQVLSALQRWHRLKLSRDENKQSGKLGHHNNTAISSCIAANHLTDDISAVSGNPASGVCQAFATPLSVDCGGTGTAAGEEGGMVPRSTTSATAARRRDSRRHTLQNGIDHNMYRRIRQLEQERVVLERGLHVVDTARHWYCHVLSQLRQQLSRTCLGQVAAAAHTERSTDANEERLAFLSARIHECSQQLMALVEGGRDRFPLHINLAVAPLTAPPPLVAPPLVAPPTTQLNNHATQRLTEEVAAKNERITMLESEKASLIRQLFSARSELSSARDPARHAHCHDSTLM